MLPDNTARHRTEDTMLIDLGAEDQQASQGDNLWAERHENGPPIDDLIDVSDDQETGEYGALFQ